MRYWGRLEGKSRSLFKEAECYQQNGDDAIYRDAGAESLSSVTLRIKYVLNLIKKTDAKSILIVSHGSYLSYFVNILLSEEFIRHPLNNLHYHKILFDNQEKVKEVIFNRNWLW